MKENRQVSQLDYRQMATELLHATHPKEKRRPPTQLERHEHVQIGTLRYLLEHDGSAAPSQLVEFFGFSHARLTKILTDLETKGLILRETSANDRRRVIVRLTDAGYALALAQREAVVSRLTGVLEILGEEDARHFLRIVQKLQTAELTPMV